MQILANFSPVMRFNIKAAFALSVGARYVLPNQSTLIFGETSINSNGFRNRI